MATWPARRNPGRVTLYRFDSQNRLVEIREGTTEAQAQAATAKIRYAYDASGNRVSRWTPQRTDYLVDATPAFAQVLAESAGQTSTLDVRSTHLEKRQTTQGPAGTQEALPLHGHLGTSLGAVDLQGNVVEVVEHDAFGNLENASGLKQKHLFAGEYWDQEAGLLYLRARWYEPSVGRFISADPFEGRQRDPRSLNRYSYAHNDPIHGRDPTGRLSLGETSMVSNIQATLGNLQADFGFNMIGGALNADSAPGIDDIAFGVLGVLAPQAKIVAKLTKKAGQLKLGKAASSQVLGDNLRVLGKLPGNTSDQAHHIVAGAAASAQPARNILSKHGIDINAPANGVWLPRPSHCGGHCGGYYGEVNQRLVEADLVGGNPQ